MAQEKYKICPTCGKANPSYRFECLKCEADLTGVRIVDDTILQSSQHTPGCPAVEGSDNGELVRSCDCGAANPSQARKCSACGEDISDVRPAPRQSADKANQYSLRSIDCEYRLTLDKPVTVIGREAEMKDYLSAKLYVSRQHAKFVITDGGVFIENISSTNRTFVNNLPISSDAPTLLKSGDEIGVGGKLINGSRQNEAAYFIFEVRP